MRAVILAALLAMSGCAYCQRHEKTCDTAFLVGSAVAIGAVVAFHDNRQKTGCTCGCPGTPPCR